ncbi:iron-sulfur cluster assembly protein, partial [Pedococcus sp. NPDC057267]|uniref:iron-sulfur cluster assembly protein n=1 Tax=Pedococcus sp. NPDC057267 TaxID=3346077 RepID=UPI0036261ADD
MTVLTPEQTVSRAAVRRALDTVIDPELDEPVTDLGFVRSVDIDGRDVTVHLRLPTSFCSPNFAYLMASDAKDALTGLAGVGRVVGARAPPPPTARSHPRPAAAPGARGPLPPPA